MTATWRVKKSQRQNENENEKATGKKSNVIVNVVLTALGQHLIYVH